jgi:ubiquinone/menaquinone biosynthesis C-methylase UbiE
VEAQLGLLSQQGLPDRRTGFTYPTRADYALDTDPTPKTAGRVIHWAFGYDLLVWVASRGRERAFREEQVDLARLAAGEFVLDIGCGTGALAVAAKRRVGSTGAVHGIDASPEMIGRAYKKAQKARVEVVFETAVAEALPFPDGTFDAVLSTLVLHHLPKDALWQCIFEMRRVLKPGGRLLVLDIGGPQDKRRTLHARNAGAYFAGHDHFDLSTMVPLLSEFGLNEIESGAVAFSLLRIERLHYVLAAAPTDL